MLIKLTELCKSDDCQRDHVVFFNTDNINMIGQDEDGDSFVFFRDMEDPVFVEESPAEIAHIIQQNHA